MALESESLFGVTENAVKTQIWFAILVYVLIASVKKRLNLKMEPYTILQILSLSLFEIQSLDHLFADSDYNEKDIENPNQLN